MDLFYTFEIFFLILNQSKQQQKFKDKKVAKISLSNKKI